MKVVIHANDRNRSAAALADLIARVRPGTVIDFEKARVPAREAEIVSGQLASWVDFVARTPTTDCLSPLETALVAQLAAGQSMEECANFFGVSGATARVYAARARCKLAR